MSKERLEVCKTCEGTGFDKSYEPFPEYFDRLTPCEDCGVMGWKEEESEWMNG